MKYTCHCFYKIEAGFSDEDLTKKEMLERYKVIKEPSQQQQEDELDPTKIVHIYHKPTHNLPYYFNEDLSKLSLKERVNKINAYHREMHRRITEAQRKSLVMAPWGPPIKAVTPDKFNGSLYRNKNDEPSSSSLLEPEKLEKEMKNQTEENEVYVLQSGRQTKRKLYTDINIDSAKKSPRKRKMKAKLTNEEIMKRSSLFKVK